jgi:hypothetical protein
MHNALIVFNSILNANNVSVEFLNLWKIGQDKKEFGLYNQLKKIKDVKAK